jgi:hypothetical protein
VPEQWTFTIQNPDDGTYVFNFVNTRSDPVSFYTTWPIRADCGVQCHKNAINAFYSSVWGTSVELERVMYDVDGVETTTFDEADLLEYTVTVNKQMESFSTTGIMAMAQKDEDNGYEKTGATITVTPPPRAQQSSPPFNGTFVVTCTDYQGIPYTSDEIDFKESLS